MLKLSIGAICAAILTMMAASTAQQGCKDVKSAWTHLAYYPIRDMRTTIAIRPQHAMPFLPDSLSVPITGREPAFDRERMVATFVNPLPMSDSAVARGERKFQRTCVPCHGAALKGDGPVAARFVPPPDLLGATSRGRSDGYIYAYIRHGGAIMPSYAAQVTAQEAYELIHYLRSQQRKNPR